MSFKFNWVIIFLSLHILGGSFAAKSYQDSFQLLPNGASDDVEAGSGDICDPTKTIPCEISAEKCIWDSLDMQYKCLTRFIRRYNKKRNIMTEGSAQKPEGEESQKQVVPESVAHHHAPEHNPNQNAKKKKRLAYPRVAQSRSMANGGSGQVNRNNGQTTLAVPEYSGPLTWDGDFQNVVACLSKTLMADKLQSEKLTFEEKKEYIAENSDKICDFTKFFHCTKVEADERPEANHGVISNTFDEIFSCRCYDSTMAIVKGKCYIPADYGAKSICGENITAPYPIKPWDGAPTLKPSCVPNSDCQESQYWYGYRCACRWYAKFNPKTHTCDDGIRLLFRVTAIPLAIMTAFVHLRIVQRVLNS